MKTERRRISINVLAIAVCLLASAILEGDALAVAGTATATETTQMDQGVVVIRVDWVGDSGTGAVPDVTFAMERAFLFRIVTVPGTPAPTAYSVTLIDASGTDITGSIVASTSTTVSQAWVPKINTSGTNSLYGTAYADGPLTFSLTGNLTNSAEGSTYFFFLPLK